LFRRAASRQYRDGAIRKARAARLDPEAVAVFVDELHHYFKRRSISAWAKNAR
jgi:hypothetical protein